MVTLTPFIFIFVNPHIDEYAESRSSNEKEQY